MMSETKWISGCGCSSLLRRRSPTPRQWVASPCTILLSYGLQKLVATDLVRCDAVMLTSDKYTRIVIPCFLRSPGLGATSSTSSISPVSGSAFVRHGDDPNYGPRRIPLHPPNGLVLPFICGGALQDRISVGVSDSDLHLRKDNDRARGHRRQGYEREEQRSLRTEHQRYAGASQQRQR